MHNRPRCIARFLQLLELSFVAQSIHGHFSLIATTFNSLILLVHNEMVLVLESSQ